MAKEIVYPAKALKMGHWCFLWACDNPRWLERIKQQLSKMFSRVDLCEKEMSSGCGCLISKMKACMRPVGFQFWPGKLVFGPLWHPL